MSRFLTLDNILAFLLGALVLGFGWDYYITRSRAFNGQAAYEYILQVKAQQDAQQKAQSPAPAVPQK